MVTVAAMSVSLGRVSTENLPWVLAVIVGVALAIVALSRLRSRRAVAVSSCLLGALAVVGAFGAALAATPCGLSGSGIFSSTPECPVLATHYVSGIVGETSCLSLFVGSVAGVAYAVNGQPRTARVFTAALIVATVLLLVWFSAEAILPRNFPSD